MYKRIKQLQISGTVESWLGNCGLPINIFFFLTLDQIYLSPNRSNCPGDKLISKVKINLNFGQMNTNQENRAIKAFYQAFQNPLDITCRFPVLAVSLFSITGL